MLAKFFIDRPIFAAVISLLITLGGGLAAFTLPISQYPPVTPPTIQVDCNYPGASAKVVAQTVAAPIEQRVNGVENMLYMSSQSTSDGSYTLTVTFEPGTKLDLAQVLVQNRLNLALPELPDVVRATGVTTRKRSPEILMTVSLNSPPEPAYPNGRYDQLYLSNYAVSRMKEELARIPGISDVTIFGQRDYSMRVWISPEKLEARELTALDVVAALQKQNVQVSLGQLGAAAGGDRPTQYPLTVVGRLVDEAEFRNVVVKATADGKVVRVRDVADVELGGKSFDVSSRFDNKETIGLAVFMLSDANALETADLVFKKVDELSKDFPAGVRYEIGYDTTPFMRESIKEVFKTLGDAVVLVALVVLLFLQTWRAAVIPLAAVPVAIVGTFGAMWAVGFGLNNLTMFGLVLAVGIVVDDAIVVVEAVQHQLEHGYAPREATLRAMAEVAGPVVAVGVVLSAVFVPCAFFSGIVGQFFRQFALTIAISTLISTFNSLTLSPALAAILLKPKGAGAGHAPLPAVAYPLAGAALGYWLAIKFGGPLAPAGNWLAAALPAGWVARTGVTPAHLTAAVGGAIGLAAGAALRRPADWLLRQFFRAFEWTFDRSGRAYTRAVGGVIRVPLIVAALYAGMLAFTGWVYQGLPTGSFKKGDVAVNGWDPVAAVETVRPKLQLPTGFIPQQDKGYLIASIQLPDAASTERTLAVVQKVTKIALGVKGIRHVNAVAGNSFVLSAYGSNFGSMFIILDPFEERQAPELYADLIASRLRQRIAAELPEAQVNVFGAPAVPGLGRAGGFKLMVEDRSDSGPEALQGQTDNLIEKANKQRGLVGLFTVYKTDSPQLYVRVDPGACAAKGVNLLDVYGTMQATLGARYVNDFNRFGRTWQVNVQADQGSRSRPEDIRRLKVRNNRDQLVPLGSVAEVRQTTGPLVMSRYNMYPAAAVNGNVAVGTSSGDGIAVVEHLGRQELPSSMAFEWSEIAFIEQRSKDTGAVVFLISLAVVFLVLAALYESWSLPLAVILVVPVCVSCSLAGVWATMQDFSYWVTAALKAVGVTDAGVLGFPAKLSAAYGVPKQDVNIFTQVGFVVLIGLACKNAILIVEYAKRQREQGADRRAAILEACRLRLRPILMTSVAFILGVTPLLFARGAGAEMRVALGTAVFSGMLGVTVFGVFLTPVFFVLVDRASAAALRHPWVRAAARVLLYLTPFVWVGVGARLTVGGARLAVHSARRAAARFPAAPGRPTRGS